MRVRCYTDIRRGRLVVDWGDRCQHIDSLILRAVDFRVGELPGVEIVTGWVEGTVVNAAPDGPSTEVRYNPYRQPWFTIGRDGDRVDSAAAAVVYAGHVEAWGVSAG